MENKWTDRDELDRITDEFEEEFDQLKSIVFDIKKLAPKSPIGNFGLYAGNKMRSFYRRFKEKDVDYANSKVNKAIGYYFTFLYDNAVFALKRFSDGLKELTPYEDPEMIRRYIFTSPDIEDYMDICEEVFQFDLDKNAVDAIDYVLDETSICFVPDINTLIDDYNEELEKLGVKEKLKHRDKENSIIDMTEKELTTLKIIIDEIIKQLPENNSNPIEVESAIQKKKTKE